MLHALQLSLQSFSIKSRRVLQKPFLAQKGQALLKSLQFGSWFFLLATEDIIEKHVSTFDHNHLKIINSLSNP